MNKDVLRIKVLYVEDNPLDVDLTLNHFMFEAPSFILKQYQPEMLFAKSRRRQLRHLSARPPFARYAGHRTDKKTIGPGQRCAVVMVTDWATRNCNPGAAAGCIGLYPETWRISR